MKCLAINAANKELSIALTADSECLHLFRTTETRDQGNILLQHIQHALDKAHIGFADLDVLGVVTGPGSFTGIRIALATMRGLALASQKPLIGISSFDLFAMAGPGVNVIALESWREELYFRCDATDGRVVVPPVNEAPEKFLQRAAPFLQGEVILSGDAYDKIQALMPMAKVQSVFPTAADVAHLAVQKFRDSSANIEKPLPFYLREADVTISSK